MLYFNKIIYLVLISILTSCSNSAEETQMKCEVCEVLKNGEMIEKYESCNEEGRKTSRSICEEMAKLQNSVCKCKLVEKLEERPVSED